MLHWILTFSILNGIALAIFQYCISSGLLIFFRSQIVRSQIRTWKCWPAVSQQPICTQDACIGIRFQTKDGSHFATAREEFPCCCPDARYDSHHLVDRFFTAHSKAKHCIKVDVPFVYPLLYLESGHSQTVSKQLHVSSYFFSSYSNTYILVFLHPVFVKFWWLMSTSLNSGAEWESDDFSPIYGWHYIGNISELVWKDILI